jgi:hypothetical protein
MFRVSRARPVHKAGMINLPPSVGRLCIQCGILNIPQPYRHPRRVTGIAYFLFFTVLSQHIVITVENPLTKLSFRFRKMTYV